jgi:hypothetical protein
MYRSISARDASMPDAADLNTKSPTVSPSKSSASRVGSDDSEAQGVPSKERHSDTHLEDDRP